jgi:hypothetical protein
MWVECLSRHGSPWAFYCKSRLPWLHLSVLPYFSSGTEPNSLPATSRLILKASPENWFSAKPACPAKLNQRKPESLAFFDPFALISWQFAA